MDFDAYLPEPEPEMPKKKRMTKAEKKLKKLKEMVVVRKQGVRDQLAREIKYTELSHKRGNVSWMDFCREIKIKELNEEMETWHRKSNTIIERKNYKINSLLSVLDIAEQQHQRLFTKHCDFLDYFYRFFVYIIDSNKAQYESDAIGMITGFYTDLDESEQYMADEKLKCEKQLHATNLIVENTLNESYNDFVDNQYDRVNQQIEKRYIIRNDIVRHMEQLHNQLDAFIKEVKHDSAGREERYDQLMERQRLYFLETANLNDAERKANNIVRSLHKKLNSKELSFAREMRDMKHERAYFSEVYWQLKNSVQANDNATETALSILASDSFETIQKLKGYVKYGELLISLAACCRKYETEREKVTPWPDEVDSNDRISFDTNQIYCLSNEELAYQLTSLKNVWYRVSKVHTHNLLLKETLKQLIDENIKYQNVFKELKNSGKGGDVVDTMKVCLLYGDESTKPCPNASCRY